MILAHYIIGVTLGNYFGNFWFIFLGSVLPDIDHLYIIFKHKIFSWREIINSIRFENKYKISYKTKYVHSLFGAIVISSPIMFFNFTVGLYFFVGYIIHLLIDWADIDKKQYLYPFKKTFQGILPISSKTEIIITIFLIFLMILSF
ncbi:MAG: metal-dependent hydrolase [Patescibacteria group bacterium]|nr:metal-dependent hydrolase [Patescibacteria group bacterium]MBU1421512.1 metal-dependent hydrolase [Patescibacteria group bacterium]MBU2415602.1 metal-dependent hydrolase [Patescibacteria group bacterium]MBU2456648.1 metal-dependent hydrolase [Patescibacteria group bacterium]MBU2474442.1 metal-dependent hydrolase [Patescibacteria group bacterium]